MYKLVAIDIDGTLLDTYGQIPNENKEIIKKVIEKGVEVVLTSGRGPASVKNLAEEVGANHYAICGNGAVIYDFDKKKAIYENYLDKKKVLQLIKICEENSIYYCLYTEDSIITKSLNYNTLYYHHENNRKPDSKKTKINIIKDIYQYVLERKEEDYSKLMICDNNTIIFKSITNKLKQVKNIDVLDVAHMSRKMIKNGTEEYALEYYYTEVTSQNVDKWSAIEYLISKIGVKPEEVMTLGDNVNDETMLKNAGLGIAMANSAPYIQEIAKEVTLSNNEAGVAKAIKKHILTE